MKAKNQPFPETALVKNWAVVVRNEEPKKPTTYTHHPYYGFPTIGAVHNEAIKSFPGVKRAGVTRTIVSIREIES